MDFRYPPEAEAFRKEFRAWLDEQPHRRVPRRRARRLDGDGRATGSQRLRAWNRTLADARYAAIAWPEEWGGRGAGVMEQVVFAEEMHRAARAGHAQPARPLEHRAGDHRARHRRAEAARSSPACSAATTSGARASPSPTRAPTSRRCSMTAVLDGDTWIVNGQKTWNTLGHIANWCELLVRTDPDVPKHKGITCLLVDMTLPGVEVRPLVTITGEKEFNEIFFTDVRVPVDRTLGPVNEGWRVAMTTLAYERGTVAKLHLGTARQDRAASSTRRDARRWATAARRPTIRCCARSSRASTSRASCSSSSPTARSRPSCTAARWGPKAASPSSCGARPSSTSPRSRRDVLGPDAQRRPVGPRPRLQPGADDRRRHHPGEQEHPRHEDPRPPPQVTHPRSRFGVT